MNLAAEQRPVADRPVGVAATTTYFPELESLRGLAMLLVLTFHVDSFVGGPAMQREGVLVSPALAYVRAGHSGVDLFFVLSAFLLSLPFLRAVRTGRRTSAASLRRYVARRCLRILPLYYSAVLVSVLLTSTHMADLRHAVPYLLFLNMLAVPMPPYSSVWWSLMTEAQFYVALPLLPLFLRTRAGRRVGLLVLAGYALAYVAFLARLISGGSIEGTLWLGMSLFGRAPQFLYGILAAWIFLRWGDDIRRRWAESRWLRGGAEPALLILLLIVGLLLRWVFFLGYSRAQSAPYHAWHVLEGALWGALLLVLLLAPLRSKPLFCNRWLNTLGVLSYSLYILHVPFMRFSLEALRRAGVPGLIGWTWQSAIIVPALCGMCLALSALTYRFIERPFLVRKDRLAG